MTTKVFLTCSLATASLAVIGACGPATDEGETAQPAIGSSTDPNPSISFTQVARSVGIDRSNEPASAGAFNASGTLAYGSWLADLDGDGRLRHHAGKHRRNTP